MENDTVVMQDVTLRENSIRDGYLPLFQNDQHKAARSSGSKNSTVDLHHVC